MTLTNTEPVKTADDWVDELLERIHQWEYLGSRITPRNIRYVGYIMDENGNRKDAMHRLFPPLTEAELAETEAHFGFALPKEFRELYRYTAALGLFGIHLSIYGWINARTSIFAIGLGYWNIQQLNAEMQARGAPKSHFYFGTLHAFYDTLNHLYLDRETGLIHQTTNRSDWTPLNTWNSLSELLLNESDRLSEGFSERGEQLFELPRQS